MTETLIDPEAWETLQSMTDPDFLIQLIDVYLSDSSDLIQQMHSGIEHGDVDGVRRAAHSLKSNSASLGANQVAEAARNLEMLAKGGTLEGAHLHLEAIEAAYARLLPELEQKTHEH